MSPEATVFVKLGQAEGLVHELETLVREAEKAAAGTEAHAEINKLRIDIGYLKLRLETLAGMAERHLERGAS